MKCCLKHPEHRMSGSLGKNLKILLMKIRQNSSASNNKQFLKNIRLILGDAIDNLSGIRKQLRTQNLVVPRALKKSSSFKDIRQVLKTVELHCSVPFWFAAPKLFDHTTTKLSDGSFGEVYEMVHSDGKQSILKIIPINGISPADNEPQLTFREIIPEVSTSLQLAKLAFGMRNRCSNFPNIYRVCVVQDYFPQTAIDAWKYYSKRHPSCQPCPDMYGSDQAFITIETENGGRDLTSFEIKNSLQALSIFHQISVAVAIAEEAYQFEHRDLHIGNILLKNCGEKELIIKFRNRKYKIETHGIKAMIIDFTYSRINTEDGVQYLELDDIYDIKRDCSNRYLDHRYVYSKMEEATKRKWNEYHPETNVFWLKHITENLLRMIGRTRKLPSKEKFAMMALRLYNRTCLSYKSVTQFVHDCILR